ncbi:MAG: tetratricopeptide repeat protein, partial [Dehalococcoidia bacterium]|nr:tetratricopeptide repeat protein [Dehalococcoidia bacterium]
KKALELDPGNANATGNYAVFMYKIRKEYDEAEGLYKKALELDPGNANNTGNYALFMHEIRKEYDEAEGLYKKALELDPGNANTTGNYSELLLTQGRFDECLEYFRRAWKLNGSGNNQLTGVFLFFWCLVNRFIGSNDSPGLSRLKWLLNTDFERPDWNFDQVLAFTKTRISPDEFAFYADVAKAILAPDKTEALNKYEAWKKLKPVDIKEPWELSV